ERRGQIEGDLGDEDELEQRVIEEEQVRQEGEEEKGRREQAKRCVRQGLQEKRISGAEEPALPREQLEIAADRPHLPCELAGERGRRLVVGVRSRLEDHPVTTARDTHGHQN